MHMPVRGQFFLSRLWQDVRSIPLGQSIDTFHRDPIPTLCTVWKSLPSVLMLGAMMISVS